LQPKIECAKVMASMRTLFLSVALVVALVLAAPASAKSQGEGTGNFTVVLSGTITGGTGWCCGSTFDFEGSGVVPGVGAVAFSGTWLGGCTGIADPTTICMQQLDLQLVSRSGDVLSLSADASWEFPVEDEPAATWTVDQASSTGRFAKYRGSGTYSVVDAGSGIVVVALAGTLSPAH
jgi:hypothetical protein